MGGTLHLILSIDTHVLMPPPPMPAMARATMSSFMLRASAQKRFPSANIKYANSRQYLRPKMSLSFPYRGLCVCVEAMNRGIDTVRRL